MHNTGVPRCGSHGAPETPSSLRRMVALWLVSKLLTTMDAVRLALGGLGTEGSVLG